MKAPGGSPWGAYVLRADRGVERFGGTSASEYPVIRQIRTNWRRAAKPSSLPVSESTLRVTRVGAVHTERGAHAGADENRDQLKQRVDQAQDDAIWRGSIPSGAGILKMVRLQSALGKNTRSVAGAPSAAPYVRLPWNTGARALGCHPIGPRARRNSWWRACASRSSGHRRGSVTAAPTWDRAGAKCHVNSDAGVSSLSVNLSPLLCDASICRQ
jgi:hypothetical protein